MADPEEYAICSKCEHFTEPNDDAENYPDKGYCSHFHLDDGEQEYDHDAEPQGVATRAEWARRRPDLFEGYPDGKIGPNSIHHSRRGKID